MHPQPKHVKYSVVIPVFNSSDIVGDMIDRTAAFFERNGWSYEIIAVNDGSQDSSWKVIVEKALQHPNVLAIDLMRNYGQNTAVYCGFQKSSGDYVINMDDDLQNNPEEIVHLIAKAELNADVVFAKYYMKKHSLIRRMGSHFIATLDRTLFGRPKDLTVTNFRIARREVIDKICDVRTPYPYIRGLLLMAANDPANVIVQHENRVAGSSQYTPSKITAFIVRILLSYSVLNFRTLIAVGGLFSVASMLLGMVIISGALFTPTKMNVPGWALFFMFLPLLMSIAILALGVHGWYALRRLSEKKSDSIYNIKETVGQRG